MTEKHDYSFFGQKTGIIISSSSKTHPFIFFKCVKKKDDDTWEKLKQGEGKTVKLSLEEISMVKKVLEQKLTEWNTFHKHEDIKTTISFKWEKDKLNVSIGEYFKPLSEPQVEVMKYLIKHLFQEKIEHATILSGSSNSTKSTQEKKNKVVPSNLRMEEVNVDSKNGKMKIKGVITGETDKALLIQFAGRKESWIPKSTIHSTNDTGTLTEQEFLIDEWIIKKNAII